MSGINLHTILGNVGNIETRYTQDGKPIVNMSIATSEKWTDKATGQLQEKTEWCRVVVFGKPAEIISQYVNKGDKLYVQGKVVTRKYQDTSGQDKYTTETVVDGFNGKFELLGGRTQQNAQQNNQRPQQPVQNNQRQQPQQNYQQPQQQPVQQNVQSQPVQQNVQPINGGFDPDIPF